MRSTARRLLTLQNSLTVEVDSNRQLLVKCSPMFEKELRAILKEIKADARQQVRVKHRKYSKAKSGSAGRLEKSIQVGDIKRGLAGGSRIGGTVTAGSRLAPYARWVHEGAPPHIITPKRKRAMKFDMPERPSGKTVQKLVPQRNKRRGVSLGGWDKVQVPVMLPAGEGYARSVKHPGYKGDPFLNIAAIKVIRKYGGARKQSDGTWKR